MTGVIFLQKDRFEIYSMPPGKVCEFLFVPEIIKDLEVIDSGLLGSLIKLFAMGNNIPACNLIIVVSETASFVKDFVSDPKLPSPSDTKAEASKFIENVPFEKVAGRTYPIANGLKAFATNQELFEALSSAFGKLGFKTIGVYPGFAFGNIIGQNFVLNAISASSIIEKSGSLNSYNLLTPEKVIIEKNDIKTEVAYQEISNETIENKPAGKKNNMRIFMLIGVFVILIVVLIITILSQQP